MKKAKFIRVDHMIFEADDHGAIKRVGKKREPVIHKQFQSINLAKNESRHIQISEDKGALGRGSVRVQH